MERCAELRVLDCAPAWSQISSPCRRHFCLLPATVAPPSRATSYMHGHGLEQGGTGSARAIYGLRRHPIAAVQFHHLENHYYRGHRLSFIEKYKFLKESTDVKILDVFLLQIWRKLVEASKLRAFSQASSKYLKSYEQMSIWYVF